MDVTLLYSDGVPLCEISDVSMDEDARLFVLRDADDYEHHLGRDSTTAKGTFVYVTSYTKDGREEVWPGDFTDAVDRGFDILVQPQLGPLLSPTAVRALEGIKSFVGYKGFHGVEKDHAIKLLRALHHTGGDRFDPAEIEVWARTHGWNKKTAKQLRDIAVGVIAGRRFRDYTHRPIERDLAREHAMVEHWKSQS